MRRYLIHFFAAAITVGGGVAGLNWLVDPYWIFGGPAINRFNTIKPKIYSNQRISEIARVLRLAPEVLILGSSREDDSLNPDHPIFLGKSVFNAAFGTQTYREARLILDALVKANHAPSTVVAGLIFESANILLKPPADYSDDNFRNVQKWKLAANLHTLGDSLSTININLLGINQLDQLIWRENGFLHSRGYPLHKEGQRKSFQVSEKPYLRDHKPEPFCEFELIDSENGYSNMDEIRQFFATAYRANVKVYFLIGPSHARQWETIAASGLWPQFEDWKRQLVKMNEGEAAKAGKRPMPFWDFSGYNSITTENVPPANDMSTRMTYYFESSHFTPAAGDLVLDRIFDYHAPRRKVPDDFGVLVTSANIDAHLAHIRTEREQYRRSHPDDVAEIEALAQEVSKAKHCRK